ncbi:MAG: adenylosuccinate lyase [Clostridia bacterium]|nr:adenylosuccinate lyase [Clostridia bacterium]
MSESYVNPLCLRYAGEKMQFIFSEDHKFSTWRRLWVYLAEAEKELGLNITDGQIGEMRAHINDIDYETARRREKEVRHDVMAHIYTYGLACPSAKPIIHLGATSCFVGDNTDIILMKEALGLVKAELLRVIDALCTFAEKHKGLQTLAYTHFQAAQPTTLGKRACLWLQDLMMDLETLEFTSARLRLLGCKGTTGTCASFLSLFDGDEEKVLALEKLISEKCGFEGAYPVSGQTYSRKVDYFVLSALSGIAQSAMKFANDMRLMSHMKEVDEPFEEMQVGSSAMAYKRNPMRSERICSLSRYVINDALNPAVTAGVQWLERTLDDSANKRISVPEAFLAVDGILALYRNIVSGMTVYPNVMRRHLNEELPFMLTENILMQAVKKGGDRQKLHELIREHSVAAGKNVKLNGADNDLLARIENDPAFGLTREELDEIINTESLSGMAERQTEMYLESVRPVLRQNAELLKGEDQSINV